MKKWKSAQNRGGGGEEGGGWNRSKINLRDAPFTCTRGGFAIRGVGFLLVGAGTAGEAGTLPRSARKPPPPLVGGGGVAAGGRPEDVGVAGDREVARERPRAP